MRPFEAALAPARQRATVVETQPPARGGRGRGKHALAIGVLAVLLTAKPPGPRPRRGDPCRRAISPSAEPPPPPAAPAMQITEYARGRAHGYKINFSAGGEIVSGMTEVADKLEAETGDDHRHRRLRLGGARPGTTRPSATSS